MPDKLKHLLNETLVSSLARSIRPFIQQSPGKTMKQMEVWAESGNRHLRRLAYNLNDISKDHPDVVIGIANKWLGHNAQTNWVVKHACRSLLKQGEPGLMEIFGFEKPTHITIREFTVQDMVSIGETLKFGFKLQTQSENQGRLRIEYAIDYMKYNGSLERKVFKISESKSSDRDKTVNRKHSFKLISTRKYYPGVHGIAIIVNGHELAADKFRLCASD